MYSDPRSPQLTMCQVQGVCTFTGVVSCHFVLPACLSTPEEGVLDGKVAHVLEWEGFDGTIHLDEGDETTIPS